MIKTRNKMLLQTDATQRATEGKANILVTPAVEILPARILAELASVWSLVFVVTSVTRRLERVYSNSIFNTIKAVFSKHLCKTAL